MKRERLEWRAFWNLIRQIRLPWFWLLLCLLLPMVSTRLSLWLPELTASIYTGDLSTKNIVLAVVTLFVSAISTALAMVVGRIGTAKISVQLRDAMWHKLTRLPLEFYDKHGSRTLISRVTSDATTLSEFLTMNLPSIVTTIYSFISILLILRKYHWYLVITELIFIPFFLIMRLIQARVNFNWKKRIRERTAELTGKISQLLINTPLYKMFAQEKKAEQEGNNYTHQLFKSNFQLAGIGMAFSGTETILDVARTILVVVFGLWLTRNETITLAIWIAYFLYSGRLVRSVSNLVSYYTLTKEVQGSVYRMSVISCEQKEDMFSGEVFDQADGDLRFENVTFAYDTEAKDGNVLENIRFVIPHGQRTVIVGPSGTGKSTVLNLLARLYTPQEGVITYAGKDIRGYTLESWRNAIGYVPQEAWLINGTVRDNLLYGIQGALSDEALLRAAEQANALEFIQNLPQGLDTPVGELGDKLSGGQRQRIAIARIFLRDPKIILLDEATNGLDARTEAAVSEALQRLTSSRTTIVVTHRIAQAKDADHIIVLEGHQVTAGSHAQLLAQSAVYQRLCASQAGSGAAVAGGA